MTQRRPAGHQPESKSTESAPDTARLSTIIASVPGIAEQSLRVTLEALSSVQIAGTATGCLSALQMVRDRQADLVVIDSNLPFEDVRVFLQQLKQEGLRTRSLVLAAASDQVRRALAAGADFALRRDVSLGRLSAVVDVILSGDLVEIREPEEEIPSRG